MLCAANVLTCLFGVVYFYMLPDQDGGEDDEDEGGDGGEEVRKY